LRFSRADLETIAEAAPQQRDTLNKNFITAKNPTNAI
jgi:hypothetical protein